MHTSADSAAGRRNGVSRLDTVDSLRQGPVEPPQPVLDAIRAVCPDFHSSGLLQRTHKAWLCAGTVHGEAAVAKVLSDHAAYWVRKNTLEVRAYRYFTVDRPPVLTPRLLAADAARAVLVIQRLSGTPLATCRYPTRSPQAGALEGMLDAAGELAAWAPDRGVFGRTYDYVERFHRYHARHRIIDPTTYAALRVLLQRCMAVPFAFAHGDLLLTNCLATPRGVALIDWEHAGFLLPGYDHALLWTLLGDVPNARHAVEHDLEHRAIHPIAFLLNLTAVLARELRLHSELDPTTENTHRLSMLHRDWDCLRDRLRDGT